MLSLSLGNLLTTVKRQPYLAVVVVICVLGAFYTLKKLMTTPKPPVWGASADAPEGSENNAEWESDDGVSEVKLRGFGYATEDEPNLLPGGHGEDAPTGYDGHQLATIGQDNSEL